MSVSIPRLRISQQYLIYTCSCHLKLAKTICTIPIHILSGSKFCGDDEQCAAMHSSISETVLEAANQDEDTGICARIPKGGLPISKALAEVPLPLAFFPLTGGDTRSWPVPQFAGVPIRLGLRDDDVFGR